MGDETGGVGVEEFVGLQPKMYLFFIEDNRKHKKAASVNKNVAATISHNEYKNVLLNNKCLRHLMKRIQSKDHRIGTYEINKNSLTFFDDKKYIHKRKKEMDMMD